LAPAAHGDPIYHVMRLHPNQDLRQTLIDFVKSHHIKAASIVTCVGSLKQAHLRMAGRPDVLTVEGPVEIVSLVGTLGESGVHLHASLANNQGPVVGGHLVEGAPVYTTAEIVLAELPGLEFQREPDPATGSNELIIKEKP